MASDIVVPIVAPRRSLVLCLDGTGNAFRGSQADSNIVKLFSLLDREDNNQFHYYQPGIGTYVETGSYAQKSRIGRIKSWWSKAKDQAVGHSFPEHCMAAYRFLMRYYNDGDKIYIFGFSRGAYTARSLAQLLDYIGLLSAGNEELLRFVWKTFAKWQMRTEDNAAEKRKKEETFEYMRKFRETFSRPVCRIEFLGLFDCVNSVPQFESAWMSRSKFPYTATTSAKVIRHAVAISERRAKFRQDLIGNKKKIPRSSTHSSETKHGEHDDHDNEKHLHRRPTLKKSHDSQPLFRPRRRPHQQQLLQVGSQLGSAPVSAAASFVSINSTTAAQQRRLEDQEEDIDDDDRDQDILEVWFAGQHGDIGGGWTLEPGESRPLSDIPLMWMVKEARKAGLQFDEDKVAASSLFEDDPDPIRQSSKTPRLQIDGQPIPATPPAAANSKRDEFIESYHKTIETSKIHDSLVVGGGLGLTAVMAWRFMEWLPFRRMDLQPDGSWKPISWPLPRGETRDMPDDCLIHNSVIKRMEVDPTYRPGNLIVGGGGRGVRVAPAKYGIGKWKVHSEQGNPVSELYIKDRSDQS